MKGNIFANPYTYFFLVIIALFLFQFARAILIPDLAITAPLAQVAQSREITIKGSANPQSTVFINGGTVVLNEDGSFSRPALLREGLNEFIVEAVNSWGIKKSKTIKLIFNP